MAFATRKERDNCEQLLSILFCLAKAKGYVWASNSYLSKHMKVSNRTIQRWIKRLEENDIIKIKHKNFNERIIYIKNKKT